MTLWNYLGNMKVSKYIDCYINIFVVSGKQKCRPNEWRRFNGYSTCIENGSGCIPKLLDQNLLCAEVIYFEILKDEIRFYVKGKGLNI